MRGIDAVRKALDIFVKVKVRLEQAEMECLSEIEDREDSISILKAEKIELEEARARAVRALDGITKLLG